MSKDWITIVLDGEITLADFSYTMDKFAHLIETLEKEAGPSSSIVWQIENLEVGSAVVTVRGVTEREEDIPVVERIVKSYDELGKKAMEGDLSQCSAKVRESIEGLTKIINGKIRSIRFETNESEWEISKNFPIPQKSDRPHQLKETYGAVQGRIQTLTRVKQYRFTLYDLHSQYPITCYLNPEYEEDMRKAWGKLATVEGIIRRNPESGLPMTVRQVSSIHILSEGTTGGWREALGCAPDYIGNVLPEIAIRRLRDA